MSTRRQVVCGSALWPVAMVIMCMHKAHYCHAFSSAAVLAERIWHWSMRMVAGSLCLILFGLQAFLPIFDYDDLVHSANFRVQLFSF